MAEPLEKYAYDVRFWATKETHSLRQGLGYIEVPSVLHVYEAVKAKIRLTYPEAHDFEFGQVERVNEQYLAQQTARRLNEHERAAVLVAHRQGYCRRSNTASDTGAHWAVCNKLRERGVFTPVSLQEKGNPEVETLKVRHGVLVAEILDSWSKAR